MLKLFSDQDFSPLFISGCTHKVFSFGIKINVILKPFNPFCTICLFPTGDRFSAFILEGIHYTEIYHLLKKINIFFKYLLSAPGQ